MEQIKKSNLKVIGQRVPSHGDLAIEDFRFTIDYCFVPSAVKNPDNMRNMWLKDAVSRTFFEKMPALSQSGS